MGLSSFSPLRFESPHAFESRREEGCVCFMSAHEISPFSTPNRVHIAFIFIQPAFPQRSKVSEGINKIKNKSMTFYFFLSFSLFGEKNASLESRSLISTLLFDPLSHLREKLSLQRCRSKEKKRERRERDGGWTCDRRNKKIRKKTEN